MSSGGPATKDHRAVLRCLCLRRHTVVEFCDRQFEDSL